MCFLSPTHSQSGWATERKPMLYNVQDDSGDKKYFTNIPNYIANHSSAIDQALYFQMKKHAGEKGFCFVSEATLMKKLGIGRIKLKKSIKYLIGHGWVKISGKKPVKTSGGIQNITVYSIVDIWALNVAFYDKNKGVAKSAPPDPRGSQNGMKGVARTATNKNHSNKINLLSEEAEKKNKETAERLKRLKGT